ncbi:MAG TPA: uracil-DNA glycosylase [Candidatus Paceibacterota bacterium]|nr:uracil-DNA glycosylase [Candidatus Paceibacterota bacterium]
MTAPTQNQPELARIHRSIKSKFKDKKLIFGSGLVGAKIVFVSEMPGEFEQKESKALAGISEKTLHQILKTIGIDKKKVYITNAVKYTPQSGTAISPKELKSHSNFLKEEIRTLAPTVVVTLGTLALNGVGLRQPLDNVHGRTFNFGTYTLVPTYHPGHAATNPQIKQTIQADLAKVKELLKK